MGFGITETILRDAHQSLIATRMTTEQMLPAVELLDKVGYHSLECWGGATFDSCLRFLNEDPWERLRKIRAAAKNTKLQMLFRGQNILGYRHYADDVVSYFVEKSIANGIDILRIFDALNDPRNLKTAIEATIREKGHVQACICYTISPVHSTESYVKLAKQLEEMGANSICIKDMAGLLLPYTAADLVKALKETVKIPIQLHMHYTAGTASMAYLKAIEAGVDVVDCALSPLALGTSQPATEPIVKTFEGTQYDCGLDLAKINEAKNYFLPLRQEYLKSGLMDAKSMGVDVNTLLYQVPGGMLSNLISQLKQAGKDDKFYEVLEEVPRVREDAGYPPLVTPTSQIVGTQAVMNVICGERYKQVTKEFRGLVRGEYGKTPAKISDDFRKKIIGDEKPITHRPADSIKHELDRFRGEIKDLMVQDEDVLSYALFDKVALKFFEHRKAQLYKMDPSRSDVEAKVTTV
ncbi:MAG: oxaloacetate decarboxylase subunit alpha [Ruminococcaceae bacterium]|nr:oxaloacetate decarboxylase subunit alpha [Oscillospiraceae bacterium]MBQ4048060.1 oxaloacetate decarboxylase subunit alpha [Clostridia bacterium]